MTDAVTLSNKKIDYLTSEVNKKPDDVEVKLITGMAYAERNKHLRWAIGTGIVCSIVALAIAMIFAEAQIKERTRQANIACERNNERAEIIAQAWLNVAAVNANPSVINELHTASTRMKELRANCDALHPVGD